MSMAVFLARFVEVFYVHKNMQCVPNNDRHKNRQVKPLALPCVVECKDRSTQLFKDLDVRDSYHMAINGKNPSIRVYSVASKQSVEANEESGTCSGRHADPNAVVLDYKLCGASIGRINWSHSDNNIYWSHSDKNSGQDSANKNHAGSRGVVGNSASNGALSSMHKPLDLMGAFRGSQVSTSQAAWSDAIVPVGNGKGSESNSPEMIISSINHDGQQIPGADISGSKNVACQIDMRKGQTCSIIQNSIGAQEKSQGTTDGVQVPVNSEVVAYSTGKDSKQLALDKTLGFDPIRQHRHFCTWIVSTSSGAHGWQQNYLL
ncbi:hypothetical protein DKX38_018527 [Salix brachista]|uniref:Uncharacterized protein n=1 Tax=Salix brachista TaxID=2182728 RepID=A0A5N5KNE5_9ROSI|nr:hypothetical protein DKX38_018527 [Salix brachista]